MDSWPQQQLVVAPDVSELDAAEHVAVELAAAVADWEAAVDFVDSAAAAAAVAVAAVVVVEPLAVVVEQTAVVVG